MATRPGPAPPTSLPGLLKSGVLHLRPAFAELVTRALSSIPAVDGRSLTSPDAAAFGIRLSLKSEERNDLRERS
eukprot:6202429-Pleurochrysis_carterae.AAC.2